MKSIICKSIILILLIYSWQASAQNKESRETGDFSKLTVTGNIRVELYPSDKNYVELEVIGTGMENLITENSNNEFQIRLKTSTPKEAKVLAKFYFTKMEKISVQNQALITGNIKIYQENFSVHARTGGKIEIPISVEKLIAEARQGGVIVLSGEAERQEIQVNSGGTYDAFGLESQDTYIKCNTGGVAKVIARRSLTAAAGTKGYIAYVGNPENNLARESLGGEIDHLPEIPN
jgi:hypothetical protein